MPLPQGVCGSRRWWAGERPLSPAGCRLLLSAVAAVRAVPCLFGFTPPTHAHPHPGPTVPDPPPPLRSVRPHGVPPCLALLPSLCTRCRPRRVLCVASLVVSVVVVGGRTPAPWLRSNPVPLRSRWSLLILARAAPRPRNSRPQGRGYRSKTVFGVHTSGKGGVSGEVSGRRGGTGGCSCRRAPPDHPDESPQ